MDVQPTDQVLEIGCGPGAGAEADLRQAGDRQAVRDRPIRVGRRPHQAPQPEVRRRRPARRAPDRPRHAARPGQAAEQGLRVQRQPVLGAPLRRRGRPAARARRPRRRGLPLLRGRPPRAGAQHREEGLREPPPRRLPGQRRRAEGSPGHRDHRQALSVRTSWAPTTASSSGWAKSSPASARDVLEGDGLDAVDHLVDAEQLVVDELGLADARHPRAGVLQAEHQAALELALAARELLVGDAARPRPWRARRGPTRARRRLAGQAADRDPDQAGVGVVAGEGEDGVGQAALLAHLLEQPRRRAAAERGVEHAEGEAAVVGAGHALDAEHEVDLLERAGGARPRRGRAPGGRARLRAARPASAVAVEEAAAAERLPHLAHDGGVVDVAGDRDDHVARGGSGAGRSARICVAGHRLDRRDGAGDRAAERRVAPGLLGEEVVRRRRRGRRRAWRSRRGSRRARPRRLGGDQRGGDHVAEHVDGQRQVLVEDPRVEAGVLLGGEGVELTADRVERDRDVQRRALGGALEQQVLEEVRAAVQRRRLVARADADPDADAGRAGAGHLLGDDPQPAGQDGTPDARGHLRRRRPSRSAGCAWCACRAGRADDRPAAGCRPVVAVVGGSASVTRRRRPSSASADAVGARTPRRPGSATACRGRRSRRSGPGSSGRPRRRPRRSRPACRRPGHAAC